MDKSQNQALAVAVAQRIRDVLQARGETLDWLASATGIARRTIVRRLHRTAPTGLTVDELNAIAIALDVHPSQLLRD
ncbi:helix-turn-helix domain-containing protein [Microbacterium arborescens]|uniref:helix-turn-helix domain-containing protein n=1 Tax=Microbacterium arborescens TaxID=33883 RepID=UPI003C782DDC